MHTQDLTCTDCEQLLALVMWRDKRIVTPTETSSQATIPPHSAYTGSHMHTLRTMDGSSDVALTKQIITPDDAPLCRSRDY